MSTPQQQELIQSVLKNYDYTLFSFLFIQLKYIVYDGALSILHYFVLLLCQGEHIQLNQLSNIKSWLNVDFRIRHYQCQLCQQIVTVCNSTDVSNLDISTFKYYFPILRPLSQKKYNIWITSHLNTMFIFQEYRLKVYLTVITNPFIEYKPLMDTKYDSFLKDFYLKPAPKTCKYKPQETLAANRQIWQANRDFLLWFDEEEKKKKWHWKRKRSFEEREVNIKKQKVVSTKEVIVFKK